LITQHNITSLALEATLGCTALEKMSNREDPSQQSVLLVTKATTLIVCKTQRVAQYNYLAT